MGVIKQIKSACFNMEVSIRSLVMKETSPLKIIVVGLPRSGTSFVAGLIERMGYSLGPSYWLKGRDEHNKHGYFECIPLNSLTDKILKDLGGDFHNLPEIRDGWLKGFKEEQKKIKRIVQSGKIELYKDNKLSAISDLYLDLYPNAKWVFVSRKTGDTYKSRFGKHIGFEEWKRLTGKRLRTWEGSKAAKGSYCVDYDDFKKDVEGSVRALAVFLGIDLSFDALKKCTEFYRPKSKM